MFVQITSNFVYIALTTKWLRGIDKIQYIRFYQVYEPKSKKEQLYR